jgi:hypothetical protein
MRTGSSQTLLWWVSLLLRLVVILGVVTLVLVAVAALGLLLFFLWVEFTAYMQSGAKLPPSADYTAISTAIAALMASITTVFAVAVAVIAGYYAKGQLKAANKQLEATKEQLSIGRRIALSDTLFRLDDVFQQYQDVREKLAVGGDWHRGAKGPNYPQDLPEVNRYIGLFERVQVLLEKDLIDIDTVDNWYGDRLINIVINPIIKDRLVKHKRGWSDFIKLWKALVKQREQVSKRWLPPEALLPNELKSN